MGGEEKKKLYTSIKDIMVEKRVDTFSTTATIKHNDSPLDKGGEILSVLTYFNNKLAQRDVHNTFFKGIMPAE